MNISFYVLSESKAQDFLGFICQLTQTALNKSSQSLLILSEDDSLLGELDTALWAQDTASFIPHQRLMEAQSNTAAQAPVLLAKHMPAGFDGIVINTSPHPVNDFMSATQNAHPTRVLEMIRPDETSMQQGRQKYKRYQQLGYELTHFKV